MFLLKVCAFFCAVSAKIIYDKKGDLNVALVLRKDCETNKSDVLGALSAIWAKQRINFVQVTPLTFGVTVYETCQQTEEYSIIFENFLNNNNCVGVITNFEMDQKMKKVTAALDIPVRSFYKWLQPLLKASIEVIGALRWTDVTVIAADRNILSDFLETSLGTPVCIKDFIIIDGQDQDCLKNPKGNFLIFGNVKELSAIVQNFNQSLENLILAPLDGQTLNDIPEGSYVMLPPVVPNLNSTKLQFFPSPRLLEVAIPLVSYAYNIKQVLQSKCNETSHKIQCYKEMRTIPAKLQPEDIVDILKMQPLSSNFVYNVFQYENSSYRKRFTYGIFNNSISNSEQNFNQSRVVCKHSPLILIRRSIKMRTDSWVFAFLSLSLLGIVFCLAIFTFLLVFMCRRDVLEGNPLLTILLLLAVILLYLSVVPVALEGQDKSTNDTICMLRTLAPTLTYAAAFSLILSRCILLATASKEIGFMSHISGSVQSFLCLFIFGVQAALTLQILGRCLEVFTGRSFVFLLSYNVMLLLLLLCLSPLVYKCQRNYREGKYFALSTVVVTFLWAIWVPCFAFLPDDYKDMMLCFGLVATASALVATIFVPRTYLMTIAAAKNKITSTLPSLTTGTSAMDLYRTGTQPVYDCINVAAINAVAVARLGTDLYGGTTDEEFNFSCDTPPENDKVTRF